MGSEITSWLPHYYCRKKLPEYYCHKHTFYPCQPEEYVQDSRGDFINVALDSKVVEQPEYVASSNIVVPKYLVHARLIKKGFVSFCFCKLHITSLLLNLLTKLFYFIFFHARFI